MAPDIKLALSSECAYSHAHVHEEAYASQHGGWGPDGGNHDGGSRSLSFRKYFTTLSVNSNIYSFELKFFNAKKA